MSALDLETISNKDLINAIKLRMADGDISADDLGINFFSQDFSEQGGVDVHALDEAIARFRRREYREMLWNLEKALGSDFAGLSDLKAEQFA